MITRYPREGFHGGCWRAAEPGGWDGMGLDLGWDEYYAWTFVQVIGHSISGYVRSEAFQDVFRILTSSASDDSV